MPSASELEVAEIQGEAFAKVLLRGNF